MIFSPLVPHYLGQIVKVYNSMLEAIQKWHRRFQLERLRASHQLK
jgi:hypothetical protein